MIIFLLFSAGIVSIFTSQLLRGTISLSGNDASSYQIWNTFLSVYQILSSENWTDVLYDSVESATSTFSKVITAFLFCAWFLVGYFVLIQLFIAVINENFAYSEDQKRRQQVTRFVEGAAPLNKALSVFERWNPYRHLKVKPQNVARDEDNADDATLVQVHTARSTSTNVAQVPSSHQIIARQHLPDSAVKKHDLSLAQLLRHFLRRGKRRITKSTSGNVLKMTEFSEDKDSHSHFAKQL